MIKIVIAGDFSPNVAACNIPQSSYKELFEYAKSLLDDVDYSIINFEAPIVVNHQNSIVKTGPCKYTRPSAIDILNYLGFSAVSLANNHFFDYGQQGVELTTSYLKNNNIDYVGGGTTLLESRKILYKQIHSKIIAFINCCETEFSIANNEHGGSNVLSPINVFYDILEAKRHKADYIIIITHGGIEHYCYPTRRMIELYRYLIDCGASAVVNHHQHCFSGYEFYNGKPIVYGLGNYYFPKNQYIDDFWNYGYIVKLCFDESITLDTIPYKQCSGDFKISSLAELELEEFNKKIHIINNNILDIRKLDSLFDEFVKNTSSQYDYLFSPYQTLLFRKLLQKRLISKRHSKDKLLRLLALIKCESHRDRLINYLSSALKN